MFSEYLIISMNGDCKHLYQLIKNEEDVYLGPYNSIRDYEYEMMMDGLLLSDLSLDVGDILMLNYDFKSDLEFIIKIKQITNGYHEKDFEIISGCGKGIVEDCFGISNLKRFINPNIDELEKSWCLRVFKNYQGYDIKDFNVNIINNNIVGYQDLKKEIVRPKNYIMNVSLEGYGNEIKRKIVVDSNVYLDNFCKNIILSMNGTLEHCYGIKIGKEYLEEEIVKERDLNYLELRERQKFKIIYDYGDNWIFNVLLVK